MSWYNPFTWWETAAEETIVDQAGHDVLLLAQARADAGAGIITEADYQALRDTFAKVHGAAALAAFDADAPPVPAGATIDEIQAYLNVSDIDMTAFQEPARDAAQAKIDAGKDKAVTDTLKGIPASLGKGIGGALGTFWGGLPAWLKWVAIGATALFALRTLGGLGFRFGKK
jgi:hypothetical protein